MLDHVALPFLQGLIIAFLEVMKTKSMNWSCFEISNKNFQISAGGGLIEFLVEHKGFFEVAKEIVVKQEEAKLVLLITLNTKLLNE